MPSSTSEWPARNFVAEWVGGALEPGQDLRGGVVHVFRSHTGTGCGVLHGGDDAGGVLNVHAHQLDDTAALQVLTQGHRRHIGVLRNQDDSAHRHQVNHGGNGGHAGGEQQAGLGSVLQLSDNLFHALPGRVRETGVHTVVLKVNGVHATVGGSQNNRGVHRRIVLVGGTATGDHIGFCGIVHVMVICTHAFKPGTPGRRTHTSSGTFRSGLTRFLRRGTARAPCEGRYGSRRQAVEKPAD